MSIIQAYLNFWRKALSFNGRARRMEYWVPVIIHSILIWLLTAGGPIFEGYHSKEAIPFSWHQGLHDFLIIIIIIPSMTLFARRLQDVDINGRYSVLFYVFDFVRIPIILLSYFMKPTEAMIQMDFKVMPFIAIISMLISLAKVVLALWPGNKGTNRFGPDPRDII